MNQDFLYNVVMAGCACTVGEMNAMLTVVFLNEIVSGVGFCHGLDSHCPWLSFATSRHWWQFKCSTVPRWHSRSSRHSSVHNNANISIFQHDNATSHTARDTVNFLRTNYIDFIDDWPANSTDLNPIEQVWGSLDRRLSRRPNPPANVNELSQALIQEWNNIPQAEINTAVVNSRDAQTRY